MRYTILATIGGVILAFNMYQADYKLLVAQIGTIALMAMWLIKYSSSEGRSPESRSSRLVRLGGLTRTVSRTPAILFLLACVLSFILSPHKLVSGQELYKVGTWIVFGMIVAAELALPNGKDVAAELALPKGKDVAAELALPKGKVNFAATNGNILWLNY